MIAGAILYGIANRSPLLVFETLIIGSTMLLVRRHVRRRRNEPSSDDQSIHSTQLDDERAHEEPGEHRAHS
jgi:hypothetical protein